MKKKIKSLAIKLMNNKLNDKQYLNIKYFYFHKKFIDWKNPKRFSEKIQWIKLNAELESYGKYVCKLQSREFVKEVIGEKYLIPLLYSGEKNILNDLKLPEKYVVKLTSGSGYNVVVKNDNPNIRMMVKEKIDNWMKEDFFQKGKEYQYKNLKQMIIVEQFIGEEDTPLRDYKFYCFKGKVEFVQVFLGKSEKLSAEYDSKIKKTESMAILDEKWNKLDLNYKGNKYSQINRLDKPVNFNEMLKIASKLSSDFPFVRVDLYNINGKIYFGELTFTPADGNQEFSPISEDLRISSLIDLSSYKLKDQRG